MRPILFILLSALPLWADPALVGTWETTLTEPGVGTGTFRLTFEEDGGFQLNLVYAVSEESLTGQLEIQELTVDGTGTWRVEGDTLFAEMTQVSLYADGRDFVEVITEFARGLARAAADLQGISDEDYPAFEQAAVEEILADFNPEAEIFADYAGQLGTYRIDDDTLSITSTEDGEVETVELVLQDPETAVRPASWGQVKAGRLQR